MIQKRPLGFRQIRLLVVFFYCFFFIGSSSAQNDLCSNASAIAISNGGFGFGIFNSTINDISSATIQTGETFAPAILVAGQTQKSIWYKFMLPTNRAVRVTLAQNGSAIQAGDVGFAVYKTNTCLPVVSQISSKLTPIGVFGSTFHPCVDSGEYLIQVSSKSTANGPVYIQVETDSTGSSYDFPSLAYNFGTLAPQVKHIDYNVDCQTIDDATEVCSGLFNSQQYNKTTWHVFKTPNYFDYIGLVLTSPTGSFGSNAKFGFRIYRGDATTTPVGSLVPVGGCDTLIAGGYYPAWKFFRCADLQTNTSYSIQIFSHYTFNNALRVSMLCDGTVPTKAPEPILSQVPAANQLGTLASSVSGVNTSSTDRFACNARHSIHPCNPSLPANGLVFNTTYRYNMSTFYTFSLASTSRLTISASSCGGTLIRLYKQALTNNCADLDTLNLFTPAFSGSGTINCVPPGNYTLQLMGRDSLANPNSFYYAQFVNGNNGYCFLTDMARPVNLTITTQQIKDQNKYGIDVTPAYDTLNYSSGAMQPLLSGVNYTSKRDTFGCRNTVLPAGTMCNTAITKAIYREFVIGDSGIVTLSHSTGYNTNFNYSLYRGDASALATAQNIFDYPAKINGLVPHALCPPYSCYPTNACVVPATYTYTSFGHNGLIGLSDQPVIRFSLMTTKHDSPVNAQDMGNVLDSMALYGTSFRISDIDYFSCKNNAVPINGYQPCTLGGAPATKAIYRQFYLKSPSIVNINSSGDGCTYGTAPMFIGAPMTMFKGKATDGLNTLTLMGAPWNCFSSASTANCVLLPEGWYTIVAYGTGPTYENPQANLNVTAYASMVGMKQQFSINVTAQCAGPKYNRPYKAAIDTSTGQPFLIQWGPRVGHTAAYPKTDTTYNLYRENFNCINDTPFVVPSCGTTFTKTVYYVFRTTQESFVQINASNYYSAVYSGDVRTDSSNFGATNLIQPCINSAGYIQLCRLPAGTYTLILFANISNSCSNVTPTIYIDQVGYSRFDHASNAYDFGLIPPDSTYRNGKIGDVNPINSLRAPSNDIIYCTTGSKQSDPTETACGANYNPLIYGNGMTVLYNNTTSPPNPNNIARRNLWYTFTIDRGGYVRVKVQNKTLGKTYQHPFSIYKSNVDGTIPFATVVSTGQVDSTIAQGLSYISQNTSVAYCSSRPNEATFYRPPCSPVTERYYVVVDMTNSTPYETPGMKPNSQLEVSVLYDSVNVIQPIGDHYSQAQTIGTNLGAGTYTSPVDNFTCATKDAPDPLGSYTSCTKSLWYKFTTTVTGHIRFRMTYTGGGTYGPDQIQLFRMVRPNDSSSTGLTYMPYVNVVTDAGFNWGQTCISPGTYYIILPGCNRVDEYATAYIKILEEAGDFCSRPINANLAGAGTSVSSVIVDCHTIGTDYGEFNNTLTCPAGAQTPNYKTSWFKINITGTDTLDVTTYLTENTNALPQNIKYRLMNGNCGAMQERSCVQDAQTQDTYKCLAPGEYFIQVFTPIFNTSNQVVTGNIDLHLSAVVHADTCAPPPACLANAAFVSAYDCNTSDSAVFTNYSTYGSAIQYNWDFGYAGQTSTAVAPKFKYPELATNATYNVTLLVTNTSCAAPGNTITATGTITIPGRPKVNLGNDTTLCTPGSTLVLNATTWSGATYQWQNGSTNPTFTVTASGTYHVRVTFNGCIKRDTIVVRINTINPLNQTRILCGNDSTLLNSLRSQGETYLWNTGATTSSIYASTGGVYTNDLNWQGCIIRDSFKVNVAAQPFIRTDTTVCSPFQSFVLNAAQAGATSYQWQNNSTAPTYTVTAAGTYWVRVNFPSCFIRDTIQVFAAPAPTVDNINASICAGQSYNLPWGTAVSTAGVYRDTMRNMMGCDSVRTTVTLAVQNLLSSTSNAGICAGQSYTLPWGQVVTNAGTYRDTIRYINTGCDSLRRTVNLSVAVATTSISNASICTGQTYTLANGTIVSTAGTYNDTLRYVGGCDSIRRTVNLAVQNFTNSTLNATMCPGQNYTLPWGTVVTAAGTYRDTLHYTTGCDSVRRTVNLIVQNFTSPVVNTSICAGQSFTLPSGVVVTTTGTYRDTLRYTTGCDSVRRTINLTVQNFTSTNSNANICAGQSYTLPWGTVVTTAGTYRDTLHYLTGCDSIRRTVVLTQQNFTSPVTNAIICVGQNYTLPWGQVVNASGIYRDTLHYITGCDSVRRTVNLTVQNFTAAITNPNICAGQNYTLPWGQVVTTAGTYRDTLHYITSCDSVRRTVNLTVQNFTSTTSTANICAGQNYTLPWGQVVTTAGTYRDTLHYNTGCDSVRRAVILTQQNFTSTSSNPTICAGQNFTLPWGTVVNTSGVYRDTLHYITGCDSVRRTVNLTVQNFTAATSNSNICAGQNYTLPWGQVVTTAGTYRDTLHYTTGCDSIRRTINLTVQNFSSTSAIANICAGQNYTLPWGQVVTTAGTYRDTLHYLTGCDSIRRSVTLTVQAATQSNNNVTICQGQGYTLPNGTTVTTAGIYRDTLHYTTGCDSLQRSVNLTVTQAAISNTAASICSDQTYTLPWGMIVNTTGIYKDTIHSLTGCDSLIRNVDLTVRQTPTLNVTKSNDVNCAIGIAKLNASGASNYTWSPASSLNNANSSSPVASPTQTTMYVVIGTAANGCVSKDSIQVKFVNGNPASAYLVPNTFSPNNDGLNDCFGVSYWGAVTDFKFTVHSRWGELLFQTTDPGKCWDGNYKGRKQDQGAYIYQITANGVCGPIVRRGPVVLIR